MSTPANIIPSPQDQIKAWRRALPSQINDSFHLIVGGKIERILAFSFPVDGLLNLITREDSTSDGETQLVLFYGLGPVNKHNTGLTFKIFANVVTDQTIVGDYIELTPLTRSTLTSYRKKHAIPPLTGNNPQLMVDAQTVTNELIPGELQRFLSYAWKSCKTSELVDQTETVYHGQRMRIERSIYDGQVYNMLNELYANNQNQVQTLVLLGLHPVIPGDERRYPFGPIFKCYTPGTKISDNTEATDSSTTDDTPHAVDFELSRPCPPSCIPPNE